MKGLCLVCPVSLGCSHSKVQAHQQQGTFHRPTSPLSSTGSDINNSPNPIVKESELGIEVVIQEHKDEVEMGNKFHRYGSDTGCVEEKIQAISSLNLNAAPGQSTNSAVRKGNIDPLAHLPPTIDRNYLDFPFFTNKKTIRHILKGKAKIMFIMRGLPGSGKSSIVDTLKSTYNDVVVCSADDFFLNENGEYIFDVEKLGSAHGSCQSKAKSSCQKGTSIVIIDNTNVKRWEMKLYFDTAKLFGYAIVLVEPKTEWKFNPDVLALRNTHGVPVDVLRKKVNTFDHVIPLYYGWFFSQKKSDLLESLLSKVFEECLDRFPDFQRQLLSELGVRNSGRVSPGTAKEIVLGYYSDQGKTKALLHCTSRFCAGGKASGGKRYDSRKDVQSSYGQVFRLTLTGLVMTKKTCGVRVTLDEKCLSLFERPEEVDWDNGVKPNAQNSHSQRDATASSLSLSSAASVSVPPSNGDGWKVAGKKKNEKKEVGAMSSKRLKKRLAKEKKKTELEKWFNSSDNLDLEPEQPTDSVDTKSKSSLSDLMNARIANNVVGEDDDGSDNDDAGKNNNGNDKDVGVNVKETESYLTISQIQEALESVGILGEEEEDSNSKPNVCELFPQLRNIGFARSAHITLKRANNVQSVETNFDVLHVCDLENSTNSSFDPQDLIPVTKGKAFYFGDGICCVYFDEPIKMDAVFSGYY